MTRDEAELIYRVNMPPKTKAILPPEIADECVKHGIETLVALGLLKLDEPETAEDRQDREMQMLRVIAWCSSARLSVDEVVHPRFSREEAVARADANLRQALGKWQMEFTACKAEA